MILKNEMILQIRKANKTDAKQIIEYLNIVGGESDNLLFGANDFYMSVEAEEVFIETLTNSETSGLFVGMIADEIVSIGSIMSPQRERISHQADIAISVKSKFWRLGIGKQLLQTILTFAKENGQTEILHLGVKSDNLPAIKLYKMMGFKEIGIYKNFFKVDGKYYDEILMNLYL